MPTTKSKFAVGIFVLIGAALALVAVFWLGMSSYLEKGRYYVAYFDESVQGLDKDSKVKYRGVSIGRVERLDVAPDGTLIEVIMKIDSDLKPAKELVAQLKSVGITGIMFIELDRKQPGQGDQTPELTFATDYPVIATKPSEIRQFIGSISDVLQQLKSLDLEGISNRTKSALDGLNQAVIDLNLEQVSVDLRSSANQFNEAMQAFREASDNFSRFSGNADQAFDNFTGSIGNLAAKLESTTGRINTIADQISALIRQNKDRVNEAVGDLNQSMKEAREMIASGSHLVRRTDQRIADLQRPLAATLENVERASQNLQRILEQIEDQPSRLIFGHPPAQRRIETPSETTP